VYDRFTINMTNMSNCRTECHSSMLQPDTERASELQIKQVMKNADLSHCITGSSRQTFLHRQLASVLLCRAKQSRSKHSCQVLQSHLVDSLLLRHSVSQINHSPAPHDQKSQQSAINHLSFTICAWCQMNAIML